MPKEENPLKNLGRVIGHSTINDDGSVTATITDPEVIKIIDRDIDTSKKDVELVEAARVTAVYNSSGLIHFVTAETNRGTYITFRTKTPPAIGDIVTIELTWEPVG